MPAARGDQVQFASRRTTSSAIAGDDGSHGLPMLNRFTRPEKPRASGPSSLKSCAGSRELHGFGRQLAVRYAAYEHWGSAALQRSLGRKHGRLQRMM
jgi:hypothetical protein